ncbi:MAG: hypothetical protein ACRDFX_07030, partial [Chloroflexota bacterium]
VYQVAQINNCVIEDGYESGATLTDQDIQDLSKLTADMFVLGISEAQDACNGSAPAAPSAAPTATPTAPPASPPVNNPPGNTPSATSTPTPQPSVHVSGIEIDVARGKSAVKVGRLSSRQKGVFLARVTSLNPGQANPSASISFARNGKIFLTKPMQRLSEQEQTTQAGTGQIAVFGDSESFKSPKKTTHYTATVSVKLAGATDTNSISFTARPSCKKVHGKRVCK